MDASCKIQRSIHDVRLTYKYVSRILGTYQANHFTKKYIRRSCYSFHLLYKENFSIPHPHTSQTASHSDGSHNNTSRSATHLPGSMPPDLPCILQSNSSALPRSWQQRPCQPTQPHQPSSGAVHIPFPGFHSGKHLQR